MVVMRAVVKRYGSVTALDGFDLRVPRGSIYGVIGPNGAGKTTAFSILAGYVRADAGAAFIDGRPVGAPGRGGVGALPQGAQLPAHERLGDMLGFYARLCGFSRSGAADEVARVLRLTELAGRERARIRELSHGMIRRAELANALLGSPELVLLDEPTAGLDPQKASHVRELIAAHRGRTTVLISSHNLDEIEKLCDHAVILRRGRQVYGGPVDQLTSARAELRFDLGGPPGDAAAQVPGVVDLEWDAASGTLWVRFDANVRSAESVIGDMLRRLLDADVSIRGVSRGRGLEASVLDLL